MSADSYQTDDIFFASTMMYVFGTEALRTIRLSETGRAMFGCEIPSLDAQEYWAEFQAGTLAVSDVKSLAREHGTLMRQLREMRTNGETEWIAARSQAWWIKARQAVQQRQQERQGREPN